VDTYKILQNTLCVLDPAITATSNSVPTTEGTDQKRKGNDDVEKLFREKISGSLSAIGHASLMSELGRARKDLVDARLKYIQTPIVEEKEVWKMYIMNVSQAAKRLETKIADLE
jgi:hypothetical protein